MDGRPASRLLARDSIRTYAPMTTYSYRLVEYDADRPWVVLANERRTVELPDDHGFGRWAREQFPGDRFRVLPESQIERWRPA
jgi:hypothetical protein